MKHWCAALALACSTAASAQATWPFTPAPDTFSPDALLDLRSLNEPVAGQSGFVRVGPDGGFVRGDGRPLRFWAVNTDVGRGPFMPTDLGPKTAPDLDRHARFLAKRGVNMVRLHRSLAPPPSGAITDFNAAERDGIWRTVAAMRKAGIYTTISAYWAQPLHLGANWGLPGGAGQSANGLLFFDPTLQAAYKGWLRRLLAEKNPYTGLALAEDPSVALIQLQNEDSLLFWTFDGLRGPQRQVLETRYGAYLATKYGSPWNVQSAWQGDKAGGDAPDASRMTLLDMAAMTQPASGGRARRLADQTEFLARTMRDFNAMMVRYLREDLKVRALVNAGNWRTADSTRLGDAERWSYLPGEVDAVNAYTAGIHQGANSGWAVMNGDRYTNESVLHQARLLPVARKQTHGRPLLVTEGGWIMPNAYMAEGPFLVAAYMSLTGVAGYYWFATGDETWSPPQSANGFLPSQAKWLFANPDLLGTFPAAALAYRMGYIQRGTTVLTEQRSVQEVFDRRTPVLAEEASFDPNRDAGDMAPRSAVKTRLPPQAFLVGPAQVAFGADPAGSRAAPLAGLVEPGVVRANTGQIVLDEKRGYCTVDAPLAQGVAAHFATAPAHQLTDVRFESTNAYGAALAVSLDGAPLRTSHRILLQYGTRSRPTGWTESPVRVESAGQPAVAGFQIQSFGKAPWQVESALLTVTLSNPGIRSATVLDMNGMPAGEVSLQRSNAAVTLRFPPGAMYVVLH